MSRAVRDALRTMPRRRWVGLPCLVCDRERSDRFSELAKPGGVRGRDPNVRAHEPLVLEPGMGLLPGSQPVPFAGEVMVVGIDEPLQQLQSSRGLGPPSGLDLLADPSLVVLVHGRGQQEGKPL